MSFLAIITDNVASSRYWRRAWLRRQGIELRLLQLSGSSPQHCQMALQPASLLVVGMQTINQELIKALLRCKVIIRHGDGYDNVDVAAASAQGIVCANKPGFWSSEVAEHSLLLGIAARCQLSLRKVRVGRRRWLATRKLAPFWHRQLDGCQIGIVGFGRSGKELATRCSPLGMEVVYYDPTLSHQELAEFCRRTPECHLRAVPWEELIAHSDIIALHLPLTPQSHHLLSWPQFCRMKSRAVVVNCARGGLINSSDLLRALQEGQIAAAALDTTEPEPLPVGHPLTQQANCLITPHIAWYSKAALQRIRQSIVQDIVRVAQGHPPLSVVNPQLLDKPHCRLGH